MREPLQIDEAITIPAGELSFTATTSSGPGGQNVNKVASRVALHWDLAASAVLPPDARDRLLRLAAAKIDAQGRLTVTSQRTRDQERNLQDAREKLRLLVLRALQPPRPRRPTRRPAAADRRRLEEKRRRGQLKAGRRGAGDR